MPNTKIDESAVTGREGSGCTLPVDVLNDNGTTALVRIEGSGVQLRQGHLHTVASTSIQRKN
jgi:hypothetical protein